MERAFLWWVPGRAFLWCWAAPAPSGPSGEGALELLLNPPSGHCHAAIAVDVARCPLPVTRYSSLDPSHAPMASPRPLRNLLSTATSALNAAQPTQPAQRALVRASACAFSTTAPSRGPEHDTEAATRPRWQQTPPRMVAPYRVRPKPQGPEFKVNEDPRRLDEAYSRLLGPGGDKVLSDEVKWLAVTHKSFDHGKRGFNDRLAYLGAFQ